jgi:hypothetical protein
MDTKSTKHQAQTWKGQPPVELVEHQEKKAAAVSAGSPLA